MMKLIFSVLLSALTMFSVNSNAFTETIRNNVIRLVLEERARLADENEFLKQCDCPKKPGSKYSKEHREICYRSQAGSTDCSGLAYFMCTGKNGSIEQIANRNRLLKPIAEIDSINIEKPASLHHQPYSIYELLVENYNGWGFHHYFTYLDNGRYVSKNAGYAASIFESFADMLKEDAFMGQQMPKKGQGHTANLKEVHVADRIVCDQDDIRFTNEELSKFENRLNEEELRFFKSRL